MILLHEKRPACGWPEIFKMTNCEWPRVFKGAYLGAGEGIGGSQEPGGAI